MRRRKRFFLVAGLLVFLVISPVAAQLPDPSVDMTLGLRVRQGILNKFSPVRGTPAARTGEEVFAELLSTREVQYSGMPFDWEMTVLNGNGMNAASTPGGKVYVLNDLAEMLGERRGLWAAVVGHELAHTARRHQVAAYMRALEMAMVYEQQKAYYKARAAAGDDSANWALLGLEIGRMAGGLVNLKLSRDEEHEADQVGMMMMAEAGYHPAYIFVLHHTLKTYLGDKSKLGAFFSDHPRWETRAQRSHAAYREAVAAFESRWPDASLSPGGVAPPIVNLGKPVTKQLKPEGLALVRVPAQIEEGEGQTVVAFAVLLENGNRVPSSLPEYRDDKGLFLAYQLLGADESAGYYADCGFSLKGVQMLDSPAGAVVSTLQCGERITVVGGDRYAIKVRTSEGKEGYVSAPFVSKATAAVSQELEFRLPTAALPGRRELKAQVCVVAKDALLLDCTREFKVKFPKLTPKK